MQEHPDYLTTQLIAYLGTKKALVSRILEEVEKVKQRLNKDKLVVLDAFSGSGVVSRALKPHAELLISNDLEAYAAVIGRCYLANRSEVDLPTVQHYVDLYNEWVDSGKRLPGFIRELYSPKDLDNITEDDRVFYTPDNAERLDTFRQLIATAPKEYQDFLLAPLLYKAMAYSNSAGHFRSFYRDKSTGVGKFGLFTGGNRYATPIRLETPVFSNYECTVEVYQDDANRLARRLDNLDLAYLDPPYNMHQYGANYFMLNLLVDYKRPRFLSDKSGIPRRWNRSDYCSKYLVEDAFADLVENLASKYLLISYNDKGYLPARNMDKILHSIGKVEKIEIPYTYSSFQGAKAVTEYLFLVEKF